MLFSNLYPTVLALSALLSKAHGEAFPKCIRDCIDSSQYSNCKVTDLACLCRAGRTSGSFLPDLVTCMHNDCIDISVDILLSPLKITCILAGAPIPDSAIDAAESTASVLATQTTTTTATATATKEFTRIFTTTITTTQKGVTNTLVIPVTIERTKTVSGEASTVTRTASGISSSGSSSSSASSATSSSSTSEESTTTILTSTTVLGEVVTGSISNTQTRTATSTPGRPASETNSAPFVNTNAAGKGSEVGSWLGLSVLLVLGVLWF